MVIYIINVSSLLQVWGVIAFRLSYYNTIEYLLICRKDTLGYIDFMRGKYNLFNKSQLQNLFDEMTINEKKIN